MRTQEYLNYLNEISDRMDELILEISNLKNKIYIQPSVNTDMKVQENKDADIVGKNTIELEILQENLLKAYDKYYEVSKRVREMVFGLPDKTFDVMFCMYLDRKSIKETADIIGISETTVRKHHKKAIELLQEKYGDMEE